MSFIVLEEAFAGGAAASDVNALPTIIATTMRRGRDVNPIDDFFIEDLSH